jgi:hypothetical protein
VSRAVGSAERFSLGRQSAAPASRSKPHTSLLNFPRSMARIFCCIAVSLHKRLNESQNQRGASRRLENIARSHGLHGFLRPRETSMPRPQFRLVTALLFVALVAAWLAGYRASLLVSQPPRLGRYLMLSVLLFALTNALRLSQRRRCFWAGFSMVCGLLCVVAFGRSAQDNKHESARA